ncbi:hypothetical protein LZL87_010000 [Fusarium oxysporum]|nr:hypothetical protein LZL87_010000 [Fusarium oxysporum]
MDYPSDRETTLRTPLVQGLDDSLTQELDDVPHAQGSLGSRCENDRDAEQYIQGAEQYESRPSKASLMIDPTDYTVMNPRLDSRFDQVRGPSAGERAFSNTFLRTTVLFPFKYPSREITLRHQNAAACPAKEPCDHWRLVEDEESDPKEKWDIDIIVTGIPADFIARGDTGYWWIKMFNEEEAEAKRNHLFTLSDAL